MQKMLNIIIAFLVILLLLLLGYYFYSTKQSDVAQKSEIKVKKEKKILFPPMDKEFNFETIYGIDFKLRASEKKIKIDGLENKIVFLKIFGWKCKYCQKEIPQLIKLKKDLGDTFEVIAIESELHFDDESRRYVKEYGINYHIVNGAKCRDFYDYLKVYYGWSGLIPLTIVLGKNGNILAYEEGVKSYTLSELMKASIARDN